MKILNQTGNIILQKWSLSLKHECHAAKKEGGWTSQNDVLHFSTMYFSARILLLEGMRIHCLQGNYFEEVRPAFKHGVSERQAEGWSSLEDALHLSTHYNLREQTVFEANCNLQATFARTLQSASAMVLLNSAAECLSHAAYFAGVECFEKICAVEGQPYIILKERLHCLRKEHCILEFRGMIHIL